MRFRADGITEAEGRVISPGDFTVRGEAVMGTVLVILTLIQLGISRRSEKKGAAK